MRNFSGIDQIIYAILITICLAALLLVFFSPASLLDVQAVYGRF